jgi:Ca-activated chloride channel family protein
MNRNHIPIALLFVVTLLVGGFSLSSAQQDMASIEQAPVIIEEPMIVCAPTSCGQTIEQGVFTDPSWLKVDYHRVNVEIENQIATTNVDLKFVNEGDGLAEGTFVFPLPLEAAVDELIMWIDGEPIESKILPADEARQIYDEIVRQYRDPALLEYIGMQAVQANVFPIPPGEERRIEIRYGQVLEADNGLIKFTYPLDVTGLTSSRRVEDASISVRVVSNDRISNIYSPSHDVAIFRDDDDKGFRAGWEESSYRPDDDFVLYYGLANENINVNLLTYRESASGDGFFMMLVQPPVRLPDDQIVPKDVIIVLDQSGSMDGVKWEQAQDAANYVLDELNSRDRFNVILFSTGWRLFSNELEGVGAAGEAQGWIDSQFAEGGTDIEGALTTALDMVNRERPTTILFLTDGLATEGVTETDEILENIKEAAPRNARIFSFGVGDDVDTFLLDSLVRNHRGTGSYVRPHERIDEEVASLYNKIGAPVLTDVEIDFDEMRVDLMYPEIPLPDLFQGTQLTIVGRYRGDAENVDITLSGEVNGEFQSFTYDGLDFRGRAGGEPFVARLWATRRIGDLLNTIRLEGEDEELVDSIVNLSVRYGIITPYTSFLIEEDDILSQTGQREARDRLQEDTRALSNAQSGSVAVDAADSFADFEAAEAPMAAPTMVAQAPPPAEPAPQSSLGASDDGNAGVGGGFEGGDMDESGATVETEEEGIIITRDGEFAQNANGRADGNESNAPAPPVNPIQSIRDKTFIWQAGVWTDTTFEPDTMETVEVVFLSDAYFDLLTEHPEMGEFLALGDQVIVVIEGVAYEVVLE